MRSVVVWVMPLAMLTLMAQTPQSPQGDAANGSIEGIVLSSVDSQPVEGVRVRIRPHIAHFHENIHGASREHLVWRVVLQKGELQSFCSGPKVLFGDALAVAVA